MSPTLKSVFLLLMAFGVVLVVIQSVRKGAVHWRHGPPAAVRDEDPIAFCGFIILFLLVAGAMVAVALF